MNYRTIFFAGPLPPPVHGLSVISAHMLEALKLNGREVYSFDLTPRNIFSPLFEWLRYLWALVIRKRIQNILYLPLSGGLRQIVDLAFVLPAILFGFQVFIHHHSFAYLNLKPWYSRLAFHFFKNSIHIALCPNMAELLCDQYGISTHLIRILSNTAFIEKSTSNASSQKVTNQCDQLTLGFISNITAEKGIFLFFDAIQALRSNNITCNAFIAGPVSEAIKFQFEDNLKATPEAQYLGAVYGEEKSNFFKNIDVLLFPTKYVNEAEPVTIWEAMANGIPVIALQRGCIKGMIPDQAGRVVLNADDFVPEVIDEIQSLLRSPEILNFRSASALAAFQISQHESQIVLESLVNEMTYEVS